MAACREMIHDLENMVVREGEGWQDLGENWGINLHVIGRNVWEDSEFCLLSKKVPVVSSYGWKADSLSLMSLCICTMAVNVLMNLALGAQNSERNYQNGSQHIATISINACMNNLYWTEKRGKKKKKPLNGIHVTSSSQFKKWASQYRFSQNITSAHYITPTRWTESSSIPTTHWEMKHLFIWVLTSFDMWVNGSMRCLSWRLIICQLLCSFSNIKSYVKLLSKEIQVHIENCQNYYPRCHKIIKWIINVTYIITWGIIGSATILWLIDYWVYDLHWNCYGYIFMMCLHVYYIRVVWKWLEVKAEFENLLNHKNNTRFICN